MKDYILDEGTKFGYAAGTTAALGLSDSFGSVLVPGFLWVPPAPGPRCLCSPEGFAPNLLIPEFIENSAQQQLVQVSRPFLP